jgi:hypothetical protein
LNISHQYNIGPSAPSIQCKAKPSSNKIVVSHKAKIKELHLSKKTCPTAKLPNMNGFVTFQEPPEHCWVESLDDEYFSPNLHSAWTAEDRQSA